MASKSELMAEISKLEKIMLEIERVSKRDDDKRWRDLIELRRSLAVQTGVSNQAALNYAPLAKDAPVAAALRQKMSELRMANADHQANWPAPEVSRDPAGYGASAGHVQQMARQLLLWLKREVAKYPD
jgi:hypothetical protein